MKAPPPLRKIKKTTSAIYTRFPDVEATLAELYQLTDTEIVARCQLPRGSEGYVKTQCIVHFLRHRRDTPATFERIFRILEGRVRRFSYANLNLSHQKSALEGAFDRFGMLIADESRGYNDRLDMFEVNFDTAYASLAYDEQRQLLAHAAHVTDKSDDDEDDGDTACLEHDIDDVFRDFEFHTRMQAAWKQMKSRQRDAVDLAHHGYPVETVKPGEHSISGLLGVTPKTVRADLSKAYALLKPLSQQGDET